MDDVLCQRSFQVQILLSTRIAPLIAEKPEADLSADVQQSLMGIKIIQVVL